MFSSDMRKLAATVTCLLLPFGAVKLAECLLVADPAATAMAVSAVAAAQTADAPTVSRSWNSQSLAAAAHIRHLSERSFADAPMLFPKSSDVVIDPPVLDTEPDGPPPLHAVVRGIMIARGENIAIVNGRQRRVGDLVNDGRWRVVAMDINERTVTFENMQTYERAVREVLGP